MILIIISINITYRDLVKNIFLTSGEVITKPIFSWEVYSGLSHSYSVGRTLCNLLSCASVQLHDLSHITHFICLVLVGSLNVKLVVIVRYILNDLDHVNCTLDMSSVHCALALKLS
jgi:hypothetical protein